MDKQELNNQFWDLVIPIIGEFDETEIIVDELSRKDGIRSIARAALYGQPIPTMRKNNVARKIEKECEVSSDLVNQAYIRSFVNQQEAQWAIRSQSRRGESNG